MRLKTTRILVAVLIVGSSLALHVARAHQPGIRRIDLQRHDRGGHFAGWEHPELFAAELRAAFSSLR